MQPIITKELKSFLLSNKKIKEVHFDINGKHYFQFFELLVSRKSNSYSKFGSGIFSHQQIIPGDWNVDKIKEDIAVGDPETEIILTMSREDVLNKVNTDKKEVGSDLISQIINLSDSDKKKLSKILLESNSDNTKTIDSEGEKDDEKQKLSFSTKSKKS